MRQERVRRLGAVLVPPAAILSVQVVLFPMPLGVSLQGFTIGLLVALLALGMALVYRANRVLNFAQADLGVVPTSLAAHLIVLSGLNWFLAMGIGLVAAAALGALVELAIVRRFFRAPRLILTVATIGIAQLLAFCALLLPTWIWDEEPVFRQIREFPLDFEIAVHPLIFRSEYFLAWVIAPLCMIAVGAFLRFTDVGTAIRASAERADRASLLGIPVQRLHTYVWSIAAVLSFVAIFLRAGIAGLPFGSVFSFAVLLTALAALTLGRLTNIPTVVLSAVTLGMLEQGVSWNDSVSIGPLTLDISSALVVAPVLGLVIVVALLLQRVGDTRAERDSVSSWKSSDEVRPVPPELTAVREVRVVKWVALAALAAGLVALPHLLMELTGQGTGNVLKLGAVVIFAIIGMSIVVLTGWAGQVSLGQMGFVAVGGAVGAVVTSSWGLGLLVALLVAGLAGAAVAMLVGLPALRLRGLYLAVTTLAFALATTSYLLNHQFFGWVPTGRVERPEILGRWSIDTPTRYYYVCLVGFALCAVAVMGIRRSRTGRVLLAMRENEQGVQAYGVSVIRAKLTAFALSGFIAAFAGALLVHHQRSFSVGLFKPEENLIVFTAAVVGGLGSLLGAVLGAVFLKGGQWWLPGNWRLFASAVGVLVVLWAVPGGLSGLVYSGRDAWLRWVARRHGIVSPSLLADVRVVEEEAEAAFEARADEMEAALEHDAEAGTDEASTDEAGTDTAGTDEDGDAIAGQVEAEA